MAVADGRVIIETQLDSSGVENGLRSLSHSIAPTLRRIGNLISVGFGVGALVKFSKQAIETASDLQEVQNVVDTAFGSMSYKMEEFADRAIKEFGISRLTAKDTGSQFMAMAASLGIAMDKASDMAISITALSADMASFYNISQDVTSTALKSIFTGETETLKRFGIVMTNINLQEFAYQQGINKKIRAMTQAERVQLRYKYVMQQTALAQGDFAKTVNSYANQTRILKEQWSEFLGVLGTGLVNVVTPIIHGLNTILSYLISIAKAMAEIFGWKVQSFASGTQSMADATQDLADANLANANATKKANKAAKGQLATFDKLNDISKGVADSGDTGAIDIGDIDTSGINSLDLDTSGAIESLEKLNDVLDKIKIIFDLLKQKFIEGFKIGLGSDWQQSVENIKSDLHSIGEALIDIFTSAKVSNSLMSFSLQLSETLGSIVGSVASIGLTIGENLVGGIKLYLENNSGYIKTSLVSMFDAGTGIAEKVQEISTSVAEIFKVFRGENAKKLESDMISVFSNSVLGISNLFANLGNDLIGIIATPISDNMEKIKGAIDSTLKPISTIFSSLNTVVTTTFSEISSVYDAHIKPLIDSIASGISDITGRVLNLYNNTIAPVLQKIANKISEVITDDSQPLINNLIGLIGDVADVLRALWKNILVPLVGWIVDNIAPVLAPIIQSVGELAVEVIGDIADILNGFITILRGVLTFIKGVFSADWRACWEGIKEVFEGVFQIIYGISNTVLGGIKRNFIVAKDAIKNIFLPLASWFKTNVWDKLKAVFANAVPWFRTKFSNAWNAVKTAFSQSGEYFRTNVWGKITGVFSDTVSWFRTKFSNAWDKIKTVFAPAKTYFDGVWSNIKSAFGNVVGWFRTKFSNAWTAVKNVFSNGGKVFTGIKDGILEGLKTVINALIDGINKVIAVPFNGLNDALEKLRNIKIAGKHPFEFLPTISVPQIPKLATGAVLPANKPFLSVVGDQKHGTNVEAPLDTIKQALVEALAQTGGTGNSGSGDIVVQIDGREVFRAVQNQARNHYNRTGNPAF